MICTPSTTNFLDNIINGICYEQSPSLHTVTGNKIPKSSKLVRRSNAYQPRVKNCSATIAKGWCMFQKTLASSVQRSLALLSPSLIRSWSSAVSDINTLCYFKGLSLTAADISIGERVRVVEFKAYRYLSSNRSEKENKNTTLAVLLVGCQQSDRIGWVQSVVLVTNHRTGNQVLRPAFGFPGRIPTRSGLSQNHGSQSWSW